MTGPEFDEDGYESFRPAPHPDDRLWRHPAEIAAELAAEKARADREAVDTPTISIDPASTSSQRPRFHTGLRVAAGLALVGVAALTAGVLAGDDIGRQAEVAGILPVAEVSSPLDEAHPITGVTDIAAASTRNGEERLAARVHAAVSASLPRVQVATADGMREGSGLFLTNDGHIATSAGLVEDAQYVLVWTDDGQRWKAETVATDDVSDLAIVQIEADDWPAASLGVDTQLWAGQYALALDHDDNEISIGEVTAIVGPVVGVDQPAALPGSAIIDDTGEVIAMVTSDSMNSYATPAWRLEQIAIDLLRQGSTTHTWLGLVVDSDPADMVRVQEVIADSPAAAAGLRPGDLIDSLNGRPTPDADKLFRIVQAGEPGDDAVLTVTRRNGDRAMIVAELGEMATETDD